MDMSIMLWASVGIVFVIFMARVLSSVLKAFLFAFAIAAGILLAMSFIRPDLVPQVKTYFTRTR